MHGVSYREEQAASSYSGYWVATHPRCNRWTAAAAAAATACRAAPERRREALCAAHGHGLRELQVKLRIERIQNAVQPGPELGLHLRLD